MTMSLPTVMLRVKFQSALPFEEVMAVVEARADLFRALPGLVQKYYLYNENTGDIAGLYLWESHQALNEYLLSELRATIANAYQATAIPDIEVFDIVKALRSGGG